MTQFNEAIITGEKTRAALENEAIRHLGTFLTDLNDVLKMAESIISKGPEGITSSITSSIGSWISSITGMLSLGTIGGAVINKMKPVGSTASLFQPTAAAKQASAAATFSSVAEGTIPGKAGTEVVKDVGKAATGPAGKILSKGILSKLPVVGAAIGLIGAVHRISQGDYAGAGLEAASGLASTIPGIGTGVSIALSGALIAKDLGAFDSKSVVEGVPKSLDATKSLPQLADAQSSMQTTESAIEEHHSEEQQKVKIDQSMLTELKKIGEFISESIKTAQLTLEAQQRLVLVSGDQLRMLERLDKNSR